MRKYPENVCKTPASGLIIEISFASLINIHQPAQQIKSGRLL